MRAHFLLQKYPSYQFFGQGELYLFICVQEEQEEQPGKGSEHPLSLLLPQLTACWRKPSGFCAVGFGFGHFVCSFPQVICGLEHQIRKLREELIQANALRNHQLLDLSLQRDEEKLKAARDKEAALNSLRIEMEKVISDLKKKHTAETEAALTKVRDLQSTAL